MYAKIMFTQPLDLMGMLFWDRTRPATSVKSKKLSQASSGLAIVKAPGGVPGRLPALVRLVKSGAQFGGDQLVVSLVVFDDTTGMTTTSTYQTNSQIFQVDGSPTIM